jgi:hypothetical protein
MAVVVCTLLSTSGAFLYQGLVPLDPPQMKVSFEPAEVKQLKELESTSIIIWASKSYSDVAVFAKSENPDVAAVSEE